MTVRCLTASYDAARRTLFLDAFQLPLYRRITIVSAVLVSCTSIGATVQRYISFISSALDPEDTWTEEVNAWVLLVKLVGLRGVA